MGKQQTLEDPMFRSDDIKDLLAALSKAQSVMRGAKEDSSNPFFKSKYADLSSVWAAARDALTGHGLSIMQPLVYVDGIQYLDTILGHSSGQWMQSRMIIPEGIKDPQAMGKVITYFRRYMLAALVGVCPEDDDAESAMHRYREEKPLYPIAYSQPSECISASQTNQIETLIGPYAEYKSKLLNFYKIDSFSKLSSDKYLGCLEAISKHNKLRLEEEMKIAN